MMEKPNRSKALTASAPEMSRAVSRLSEDGIAYEVNANPARSLAFVKVNGDRFRNLLLQIPKVLPLRRNSAGYARVILPCHKQARFFVLLNLESDLFHSQAHYFTRARSLCGIHAVGGNAA